MTDFGNEIERILSESLISPELASQLDRRARELDISPLDLLYDSGLISQSTVVRLRNKSIDDSFLKTLDNQESPPAPDRQTVHTRYQLQELLGKGGMGKVYRAYDPQLKRQVAIKLLNEQEPARIARFIREAHAQARVRHPNVAAIYEIGEAEQQPYIAMQLIHGRLLDEAACHMTLETRVLMIMQVAAGVHEAHRSGLVHRDIKPANIMVEQDEIGRYVPYVLDFGLAFFEADHTLTIDGSLLGTPVYMAPEQARGDLQKLDRRTDVYALGATLYHILVGRPPFEASSRAELLRLILDEEPLRPRHLSPEIPLDIQTIILKCLAKEPDARYASARALADDLGRFLDGEPIEARPAGFWYRLSKKARKHKTAVAVGVVALFLLSASLGWGLWRTGVRTRLTARLIEQVERIEALARFSHMAPPHDIRPDRARLQQRMEIIKNEMDDYGSMADGPGNYALGWGWLQFGDEQAALEHLNISWQAGYQNSRAAYALGLANSAMFRDGLLTLATIEDGPARRQKRLELERRYRDPALDAMRRVDASEVISPEYLMAMIAFLEERYADAHQHLKQISRDLSWFYEAHKLEGDLYHARVMRSFEQGDVSAAETYSASALTAYERAAEIAPSNPQIPLAQAAVLVDVMTMKLFETQTLTSFMEQGLAQIETASRLLPETPDSLLTAARLYRRMALQHQHLENQDPRPMLEKAIISADLLASSRPDQARIELAAAYNVWAEWLATRKQDPDPMIEKGLEALQEITAQNRHYYTIMGRLQKCRANWLGRQGKDPCAAFEKAALANEQALILLPGNAAMHLEQAITHFQRGFYASCQGVAPKILIEAMLHHLEQAEKLRPDYWVHAYYQGLAWRRQAQGFDDQLDYLNLDLALKAEAAFQRALKLDQNRAGGRHLTIYNELATIQKARARQEILAGRSPEELFAKAVADYRKALEIAPNHPVLLENMAWVHYDWGKFLIRQGQPGSDHLNRARELTADNQSIQSILCRASALRMLAEWRYQQNQNPMPLLARAETLLTSIQSINPEFVESWRSLGRLHTLAARYYQKTGQDASGLLERARKALQQIPENQQDLSLNQLAHLRLILHEVVYMKAKNEDYRSKIAQGLEQIDQFIKTRPDQAEAKALRACLLLLKAPEQKEQAREKLMEAIAKNHLLEQYWTLLWQELSKAPQH